MSSTSITSIQPQSKPTLCTLYPCHIWSKVRGRNSSIRITAGEMRRAVANSSLIKLRHWTKQHAHSSQTLWFAWNNPERVKSMKILQCCNCNSVGVSMFTCFVSHSELLQEHAVLVPACKHVPMDSEPISVFIVAHCWRVPYREIDSSMTQKLKTGCCMMFPTNTLSYPCRKWMAPTHIKWTSDGSGVSWNY